MSVGVERQPPSPIETAVGATRSGCFATNVVTVWLSSVAVKAATLTGSGALALRSSVAEVTHGVTVAGGAPREIEIGSVTAESPLLMATITTAPSGPLNADKSTDLKAFPVTSTLV